MSENGEKNSTICEDGLMLIKSPETLMFTLIV